jgi:Ca2+-binding EF-hand superfamily protein
MIGHNMNVGGWFDHTIGKLDWRFRCNYHFTQCGAMTICEKEHKMSMNKLMIVSVTTFTIIGVGLSATGSAFADDKKRKGKGKRGINIERIDTDKSGAVSLEEFASVGLGKMIAADKDGDGILSTDEISAEMEAERKRRREEAMMKRLDVNGDGSITVVELQDRMNKQFAVLDRNSDGSLSTEELRKMRGKRKGNRNNNRR